MIDSNNYPKLTDIVSLEKLPEELNIIDSLLQNLLDDLYYSEYHVAKSRLGDVGYYQLRIISLKKIGFTFPGTEIELVLNPTFISSGEITEIPLSFQYKLEIIKYAKALDPSNFSANPRQYFDVLLSIVDLSTQQILQGLIIAFLGDISVPLGSLITIGDTQPAQDFIANFNSKHTSIANPLVANGGLDPDFFIDLVIQIQNNGLNVIETIFDDYINLGNLDETIFNLKKLFKTWFGNIDFGDILKKLLIPQIRASIDQITLAVEFPRNIFVPVATGSLNSTPPVSIGTALPEPYKTFLTFDAGSFTFTNDIGFHFEGENSFDFQKSFILGTEFTLELSDLKIDLSRTKNIPEADADGRPDDFVGVFITDGTIGFPQFWNHNDGTSTGEIKARNLLVGTGGISGTLGMEAKTAGNPSPLISARFGEDFQVSLDAFDITFQQNSIIESNIHGTMKIPGFKDSSNNQAELEIDIHIGTDGDFSVTASEDQGITAISIPDIFELTISSLSIGRNDDRFFVAVSGLLDFHPQGNIGKFLPDDIEIKRLIIYDDGTYEFEGGALVFPKAYTFKMGPAEIAITAVHMGTHEQEHNSHLRKYKYFGFDGGVSINPGGVDARGNGVKFYFTVDNDLFPGDPHFFFRIQSLYIDLVITAKDQSDKIIAKIKGYLAMQEPKIPTGATPAQIEVLKNSTEYAGSIDFELPQLRDLKGTAAMRYNPDVPSFIIDMGIEIAQPIVLGSSGLGIYGFRALFGRRYVTSKGAAFLPEDAEWWQYYKAKVDPDYKEGIQVSKFASEDGLSLGAGVSLATTADDGKAFSSKLFLLLSLPDVLIFQGQAQILKDRIGLDTLPDPPFFAFVAISNQSVEAAFGVDYKLPDEGSNIGKIVTVSGVTEMGFFFGNSAAWYVNIGRETPAERRIQARVVDLFNMYFYLMLSSNGMRAGAGASWELNKKFGPLRAELGAYLDIAGRVSRRPKQIGGSIQLGGNVGLYIFKFGFNFSVSAALAAESSKPRIVTGEFEVCVRVLKKDYCAHFDLTWNYDNNLDTSEVPLIETAAIKNSGKSKHMLTLDTLNLYGTYHTGAVASGFSDIPQPNTWPGSINDYIIPLDSFVDLQFKKGMHVSGSGPGLDKFGGITTGANFIEFVAPQRGKSDRVRHEYKLNRIDIVYYDANGTSGGTWQDFDFYTALTPQQDASFVDQTALQNLKYGYWQIDQPGNYNKLKILAQDPLSYILTGNTLPEDFGVTDDTIFCPDEPIEKTCINFNDQRRVPAIIPSDQYLSYKDILFQIVGEDGMIVNHPFLTFPNALSIIGGDTLEIYFNEPMSYVSMLLQTMGVNVKVEYYERASHDPVDIHSLPTFTYDLIASITYPAASLAAGIVFDYAAYSNKPVEKIIITAGECSPPPPGTLLYCTSDVTTEGKLLQQFFSALMSNKHFLPTGMAVLLWPNYIREYDRIFFNTLLYQKPLNKGDNVILTSGYVSNTELRINITDEMGYDCTINLKYPGSDPGFSFAGITSFENIRPNPAGMVEGINYSFLIDLTVIIPGGDKKTFTIEGTSCYKMGVCSKECSTFLYQFCYLSVEDALYNQTIPSGATVNANNSSMLDGITKTLQPIWRPNTIYAIRMEVSDLLYREGGSSTIANHTKTFIYGFKTAGPVGHYHKFPTTTDSYDTKPEFTTLVNTDREAEFKIHNLGLYIDYPKCFPNADSVLLNAKPLYYKNPKLLVFYTKPYVYQFYNNWDQLGNAEAIESSLETLIKDPAEKSPATIPSDISVLAGITGWLTTHNLLDEEAQIIPQSTQLLSNMLDNGNGCFTYPTPLLPIGIANEITIPEDLKPLKLYTAIMNAKYKRVDTDTKAFVREVHRYSFETSRYGNFDEHINSYILKSHIDTVTSDLIIDKTAVYTHEQLFASGDITIAQQFVINPDSVSDNLLQEYAHPYDRIMDGILKLKQSFLINSVTQTQPLPPAPTTEFNFIKDTDPSFDKLIGILLRSPEPFNDPKIPQSVLDTTILVEHTSPTSVVTTDYKLFFSKDKAKIFITKSDGSLNMPQAGTWKFTFNYMQFNGNAYVAVGTPVEVELEF